MNSYTAPLGFVFASLLAAQSGTPYNLTTGYDLTGNNQFNARPAYGVCGAPGVVTTRYGCLDTNPAGKGERIVPFGVGLGPANALLDVRVSKTFGVGPRIQTESGGDTLSGGDDVSDRGIGSGGAAIKLNAGAPRRYSLTFVAGASNILNIVNLAPAQRRPDLAHLRQVAVPRRRRIPEPHSRQPRHHLPDEFLVLEAGV